MRKRYFLFLFTICLTCCLCACGGSGDSAASNATPDIQGTGEDSNVSSSEAPQQDAEELTAFDKLFANGPIPAQDTSELWGYIDSSGEWVIPPTFSKARAFWDSGLAFVLDTESQLWGLIDSSGQYVVEPTFYNIGNNLSGGLFRVSVPDHGWGYIDTTGSFVIEPQFDKAYDFSNGFARVSNQMVITTSYSYDLWGYINTSGERITEDIFYEAYDFSEGLACVNAGNPFDSFYGYIDESGTGVILPEHSAATSFSNGVAFVDMWDTGTMYYALIGKDGYPLTGPICSNPGPSNGYKASFNYGLRPVRTMDMAGYIYINTDGETVLPKTGEPYQFAESFSGEYAMVCENDLWGYIDLDGNWVVPPQYASASNFLDGMALVQEAGSLEDIINDNTRRWIIDTSGTRILEFGADVTVGSVAFTAPDRIPVTEKASGKTGFWNLAGDIMIGYIYDDAQRFATDYSYAKVQYDGLWGMIDKDGNWLIPAQFMSLGEQL